MICVVCGRVNPPRNRFCPGCGARIEPSAQPRTRAHLDYAGFQPRLVAAIIDWVVIFALLYAIQPVREILHGMVLDIWDRNTGTTQNLAFWYLFIVEPLMVLLIPFAYHFIAIAVWGRTVGKSLLHLRVVAIGGNRVRVGQALVRETIGKAISSFFLLGFLWAAFNEERETWHDSLARTRVVNAVRQETVS